MKLDQFLWPAATLWAAVILAAAIVTHGVMLRPARYTFYYPSGSTVWRGDASTGEAVRVNYYNGKYTQRTLLPVPQEPAASGK